MERDEKKKGRSEKSTSETQSLGQFVCRLLLKKKKQKDKKNNKKYKEEN